ncbi:MAG: ABC transporter ATP-binding protein/permease, partial [Bacteroidia bacterium]|nr:ABC transporter ATP-binding protein/permease [Bacteroidia bacterium]
MAESKKVTGKAVDLQILKRIFSYIGPHKKIFVLAATTTLTLSVIAIVRPLIVKYTLDNYISIPNAKMLMNMTMLMLLSLITEAFLQFSDSYLTNKLGQSIIKDLRIKVFSHILNFKLKYYDNTPIGTLVTRSVSDIEVIADIFSEGLIVIIGDILKVIIIIIAMFTIDFDLTLMVLIPIPLLLIATYIFKRSVAASFQEVRTQVARLNSFVQEHITGINIIQIFNREKEEMSKFDDINVKHRDANIRSIMSYSIFFPIVEILSSASLGLLVWWGGKNVLSSQISLGDITAFIMLLNYTFRPIRQLADRFNTLQMGMVSSERVFKILDTEDIITDHGTEKADHIKGDVAFNNVYFAYNNEDWILKNISFSAKTGQTIALVGATGAGKSSIINLLNRFYEYNKGTITIDGINIRDYELTSLRKNIGVVLQDVFLFSDSILNNITLNNPEISKDKVIEAARIVG